MYHELMIDSCSNTDGYGGQNSHHPSFSRQGHYLSRILPAVVFAICLGSCSSAPETDAHLMGTKPWMENPFHVGGAVNPSAQSVEMPDNFDLVLSNGVEQIMDVFYRPLDWTQIVRDGVASLKNLDPGLSARVADNTGDHALQLIYHNRIAGIWPMNRNMSGPQMGQIMVSAIRGARKASPTLSKMDDEKILETVFTGMTHDLDKFSRYVGRKNGVEDRYKRDGGGSIGLDLRRKGNDIIIDRYTTAETVLDDPDAPLQSGDQLIAIDGQSVTGQGLKEIVARLQGDVGTMVTLDIARNGQMVRNISLVRERIIHNTVTAQNKDHVAFLAIERFNAATAAHLEAALKTLLARDAALRGIVLDLRGNPGGLLDQAVAVADLFLEQGTIITTRGRHPDSFQHFDAHPGSLGSGLPMIIMVDGGSASAAEVVSATLQDHRRALVIGTASYGKGSVQTVTNLPNDGELFVTWSEIFTPSGDSLNHRGVVPNICSPHMDGLSSEHDILAHLQDEPVQIDTAWSADQPNADLMLSRLRNVCPAAHADMDDDHDRNIALALMHNPAQLLARIMPPVPTGQKPIVTAGRF